MKLAYFVHDLADPAVRRRVRMLKAGGAEPVILGFRRTPEPPPALEGCPTVDLGRTYDARLGHRAKMTALAALASSRHRGLVAGAEVVMARTLEMLAIAEAARWTCGLKSRLVYECLDIHRLMLAPGAKGEVMRRVERQLMRRSDLLVVSSPAFLDSYFRPVQGLGTRLFIPVQLVENKVLDLDGGPEPARLEPPAGPPWRIAWMGAIRCRKSLDILFDLAARRPDLVEVQIHGRPAYTEFEDFDGRVTALRNLRFGGAYAAEDLPRLYGDAHFSWAIDFMEEGLNSAWLLPNRVYESGLHGCVPVALRGVQTGRFLADHGIGVRLEAPADLEAVLERMTTETYAALRGDLERTPPSVFRADRSDCEQLVAALRGHDASVRTGDRTAASSSTKLAA